MLNLVKMDMYRLVRMKSFWIMIAVTVLLACLSVFLTDYALNLQNDVSMESGAIIFDMAGMAGEITKIDVTDFVNTDLAGLNLLILCVIFGSLFVNGEQKNGFVKNIAGQLPNRGLLVLSKLVAVAVQVTVIFAAYILTMTVLGKVLWADKLVLDSFGDLAKVIGIHYLLHFAMAVLVSGLTLMLRGSGLSMTFGIICSTGAAQLIYRLVNILLHKCGVSESFDIADFALESCIHAVTPGLQGGDLTRMLAVGIGFILVSTLGAILVMQKRDIR